jgi:thiol-disulfide isomerase/thioredoxin
MSRGVIRSQRLVYIGMQNVFFDSARFEVFKRKDVKRIMKRILISTIVVMIIAISGCTPPQTMQHEASSIQTAELVVLTSIDHLYEIIGDEKVSYIYFGRPTCPDCVDFFPILEDVMDELSQIVYYFNTDERRVEDEYEEIMSIFDVVWVPTVFRVENSIILDEFPVRFERNPSDEEATECRNELSKFFTNIE